MRALFCLLFLGCQAQNDPVSVSLSITPANLTRPCLVSRIAVFDDQGEEYRAGVPDCNEAVITLAPGRRFGGFELISDQAEALSVIVMED